MLHGFSAPVVDPAAAARWRDPAIDADRAAWETAVWGPPEAFAAYREDMASRGRTVDEPPAREVAAIRWCQIGFEVMHRQVHGIAQPWEGGPSVAVRPDLFITPAGRVAVVGPRGVFDAAARANRALVELVDAVLAIPGADPAAKRNVVGDIDAIRARVGGLFPQGETAPATAAIFALDVDVVEDGRGGRATHIPFAAWRDFEPVILFIHAGDVPPAILAKVDPSRKPAAFQKARQRLRRRHK